MARLALRTGAKAMKLAMKAAKKTGKPKSAQPRSAKRVLTRRASVPTATSTRSLARTAPGQWTTGIASGVSGARRYRLFKPSGVQRGERLPVVVMLHGCAQDAQALAASTKMNRLAQAERFMVLYPEQDRLSNLQNCWNWFGSACLRRKTWRAYAPNLTGSAQGKPLPTSSRPRRTRTSG